MKKMISAFVLVALLGSAVAQQVSKITFANNGNLEMISLAIDDNVIINMSDDGSIQKFGLEPYNLRTENFGDYTDRVDPYGGRIEYYSASDNESFRGKVKYIGKTLITYYASYDEESMRGKIRSIGTGLVGYYQAFEDKAFAGKLKNIGSIAFGYYSSFDNESFKGRISSIGVSKITYYTSYEDKAYAGKIKSIGNVAFTYYSSYDRIEYRGARKTGQAQQYINGIKFYLK